MSVHWGGRGFGHVSRKSNATAAFSPLSLTPAIWYDPSDLSSMFQNSNGTTAGVVDSPVGYLGDKSGNGNHAIQATSGQRPTLRSSAGLYWLEFASASSQCLQVPSCTLPTWIYVCLGVQQTNANPFLIEQPAGGGPGAGAPGFWFYGNSGGPWTFARDGAAHSNAGVANWPGTSATVAELLYGGTGTYSKDGVAQSNGSITGTARANSNVTDALDIMSRNQSSLFLNGNMYGLIIAPSSASSMQAQSRTWMGAKAGLTL